MITLTTIQGEELIVSINDIKETFDTDTNYLEVYLKNGDRILVTKTNEMVTTLKPRTGGNWMKAFYGIV